MGIGSGVFDEALTAWPDRGRAARSSVRATACNPTQQGGLLKLTAIFAQSGIRCCLLAVWWRWLASTDRPCRSRLSSKCASRLMPLADEHRGMPRDIVDSPPTAFLFVTQDGDEPLRRVRGARR